MLTAPVVRRGQCDINSAPTEFVAGIHAEFIKAGAPGFLVIGFATDPAGEKRQSYMISVMPEDFAALAKEMMRADPASTIRAFGTAVQDFRDLPRKPEWSISVLSSARNPQAAS